MISSDEDAQLLNEVTTRMATENVRVNRAAADSRTRGDSVPIVNFQK